MSSALLLSACGKAAPEAGSQPSTSSQPPTSSSTGTTAPPTTAPPTTAPPVINQEVTPKASYAWNGSQWPDTWGFVHYYAQEMNLSPSLGSTGQDYLEADSLLPVYYQHYIPAVMETAPDDAYFIVQITAHPIVIREYGMPDGSEEYNTPLKEQTAELRKRLEAAGYAIYPEVNTYYEELFGDFRVVTIMSVAEMKALNCGDDFSVEITEYHWPN